MRTSRVVIPCVVLLSVLGLADACAEGDAPPAAEGKADYLVRPGDLLGLWVYKVPDFQIELRVAPNGNLRVPVVGSLDAAGKTLEALTEAIVEGLKKRAHLLDPQVALTVKEFAQEIAYIHGAVIGSKECKLPNDRSMTVSQAVAVGGGLRPEARADAVRVIRRTRGGKNKEIVVDLIQVTEGGKPELDISLEPGDVVYVPYETGVFVIGGVQHPGYFDQLHVQAVARGGRVTASQALALAGGLVNGALAERAQVIRRGAPGATPQIESVNLHALMTASSQNDALMQPGDTLFIPQGEGIYVLGDVRKGGVFYPPAGGRLTVTKALSMAEGIEKFAKLSSVRVIRKNGITEINVDDLTKKEGSLSKDIELEPGDVVYVPKGF